MNTAPNAPASQRTHTRKFCPASAVRLRRLRHGLTLQEVATEAGLSLNRASAIERHPEKARAGEIEGLENSINAIAARRRVNDEKGPQA